MHSAKPDTGAAPRGPIVMIVDDEPQLAHMMSEVLSRSGLTTLVAGNCKEAWSLFVKERGQIATLVLDCCLHGESSKKLHRDIRNVDPNINTVVISGLEEKEMASRFAGEPVNAFLRKPFSILLFKKAVYDTLSSFDALAKTS